MLGEIQKKVKTETAHIVRGAYSKKCAHSIHGHSYEWIFMIEGEIDPENGMILDFGQLKDIKNKIELFDHATVLWSKEKESIKNFFFDNFERVIIMKKNPTAENMARLGFKIVKDWIRKNYPERDDLKCVEFNVKETDTGCAYAFKCDDDDIIYQEFKSIHIYSKEVIDMMNMICGEEIREMERCIEKVVNKCQI